MAQAAKPYKVYSLADRVELPAAPPATAVEETIAARRSCRTFSGEPLQREELSRLLRFGYGLTDPAGRFRAVASGGALYPLEIYVIPNRVEGLERWVYHYDPEHHRLDVVDRTDRWAELPDCVWLSDMKDPDSAAALLVITAVFERTRQKYLDRGYRLVLFEAGEVAHNLSLLTTALGLGGYLLGGFLDDRLSAVLGIDGTEEAPLVPMAVGRPAAEAAAAAPATP
jgi:SagB-type dehydrogenase family enzyme